MLGAARDGDVVLAAWPGEWTQDIFVVDDLGAARTALGVPRRGVVEARQSRPSPRLDSLRPAVVAQRSDQVIAGPC